MAAVSKSTTWMREQVLSWELMRGAWSCAWAPGGVRIAVHVRHQSNFGSLSKVHVYSVSHVTHGEVLAFMHVNEASVNEFITAMSWSPDARALLITTPTHIRIWFIDDDHRGSHMQIVDSVLSSDVSPPAWSPCGQFIAGCASITGRNVDAHSSNVFLRLWRLPANGARTDMMFEDTFCGNGSLTRLAWSLCGKYIACGIHEYKHFLNHTSVAILDVTSGCCSGKVATRIKTEHQINRMQWSSAGCLAAADTGRQVYLLSAACDVLAVIKQPSNISYVSHLAWSSSGTLLATLSVDYSHADRCTDRYARGRQEHICVWSASSGALVTQHTVRGLNANDTLFTWLNDDARLVITPPSHAAYIWTLCKWMPRTHCKFPFAMREMVLRVMCAIHRLDELSLLRQMPRLPMEIWLLVLELAA